MCPATVAEHLSAIGTETDPVSVDEAGELLVDGFPAGGLLEAYGSPLYVLSENTLRLNHRRIRAAFAHGWPGDVTVMYAIKANSNPAVRAVMHSEGAGGDCFGVGELEATFLGGADPAKIALNGGNKTRADIRAAVERGVSVNLDEADEVDLVESVAAELGRRADVRLRLRVIPAGFERIAPDYFGGALSAAETLARWKWGVAPETAAALVERLAGSRHLRLRGFMAHIGRVRNSPEASGQYGRALGETIAGLVARSGYRPGQIDIGGGWPRRRDPESRSAALSPHAIEEIASAAVAGLREGLGRPLEPAPELLIEPGRYIVGNAGVLLGRLGNIKTEDGRCWVNTDVSTNLLMRIDTSGSVYHILPASGLHRRYAGRIGILVGSTCVESILDAAWRLPERAQPGEPIAVLDAGMYAEAVANQFNSLPRPATVMIGAGAPHLVRRRETVEDLFRNTAVPAHLRSGETAAHEARKAQA